MALVRAILFLFSIALWSCSPKDAEPILEPVAEHLPSTETETKIKAESPEKDGTDVFIRIQKTPCFGKCPVYSIVLHDNGDLVYNGLANTPLIGEHYGHVDSTTIEDLLEEAYLAGFDEMNDQYPGTDEAVIQDLPRTITTIHLDGEVKTVVNIYDAPKALRKLEQVITETLMGQTLSDEKAGN